MASPEVTTSPSIPVRVKPRLRGVSHELAAIASLPAVAALLYRARGGVALLGASIYGATLVILFVVSALYHRRFWSLPARRIIGRIDHSAIFLLIAGTYTPIGLLIGPGMGHVTLAVVWVGATAGIVLVVGQFGLGKRTRAAVYVLLGWVILPLVPRLNGAVGPVAMGLFFAGGFLYTVGAVIYGLRRPDPFPRTFGFHEIFHLLVVAAAASHYVVVDMALQRMSL